MENVTKAAGTSRQRYTKEMERETNIKYLHTCVVKGDMGQLILSQWNELEM